MSCPAHEEADTRMMAHLSYCVEELDCQRVVIESADTDVVLLSMYHFCRLPKLQELYIHRNNKFLHVHSVIECLDRKYDSSTQDVTANLLSAFALTGCDSVSYPFRRGKKMAAKIVLKDPTPYKCYLSLKTRNH